MPWGPGVYDSMLTTDKKTMSMLAGIGCEQCHGPVAEREQLFKEKSINMVACMDCHTKHKAPNDCNLCHDPG